MNTHTHKQTHRSKKKVKKTLNGRAVYTTIKTHLVVSEFHKLVDFHHYVVNTHSHKIKTETACLPMEKICNVRLFLVFKDKKRKKYSWCQWEGVFTGVSGWLFSWACRLWVVLCQQTVGRYYPGSLMSWTNWGRRTKTENSLSLWLY